MIVNIPNQEESKCSTDQKKSPKHVKMDENRVRIFGPRHNLNLTHGPQTGSAWWTPNAGPGVEMVVYTSGSTRTGLYEM